MRKITILGGGISGLSLAYFIQKKEPEAQITLLEKRERLGGWCHSEKVGGFLFEKGPRCFKASRAEEILSLVKELDLQREVIHSCPGAETRYIYHRKRLRKIPTGPFSFLRSSLTRKVCLPLLKDFIFPKRFEEKETIHAFVEKRLGKHAAEILFDPFTLGIYAGNAKKLSMKECFPSLYEAVKQKKSILSAMRAFQMQQKLSRQLSYVGLVSFRKGNFSLIQALAKALKKVTFHLGTEVSKIEPQGEKILIFTPQKTFETEELYLALPKQETQRLFFPLDKKVHTILSQIECASVASVNLGFEREFFSERFFGYLVPSLQKDMHMGTLFESSVFPEKMDFSQMTALGVMLGGAQHPEVAEKTEKELVEIARNSIKKYLKIEEEPKAFSVTKAIKALPQFYQDHKETIENLHKRLQEAFPKITLVGNYLEGVSVNDCIAYSKKIGQKI